MSTKSVCIVGAGFSGIAAARVLDKFGYEVTLFEKAPDVGGVWSKIRRYPGVATQNTKDTYYLSEMPMPEDYPAWPSGQQVQAYLESFVTKFDLKHRIHLCEAVAKATQDPSNDNSWTITTRESSEKDGTILPNGKENTYQFDVLLVCNGTFSDCFVPNYKGIEEFRKAGGIVCHTSEFLNVEDARDKDVIIVGYGKSACDCAVALSRVARTTTVVARKLIWKLPKFIGGLCYKFLFLGRIGENLFPYIRPGLVMRLLHGPLIAVRNAMVGTVEWMVRRQLKLETSGALPPGHFEDVARASISLVTEEFFERMRSGQIVLKRDTEIEELLVEKNDTNPNSPVLKARLADGSIVPAQIVACGTGFHQRIPFLDQAFVDKHCTDEKGNFRMYRFIKPIETEKLFFVGYNSSLFCPTSFEVATLWCISVMEDSITLPPVEEQKRRSQEELDWMKERTRGKHSKGTNVVPFSLHNIDDMLSDLKVSIGWLETARQWLLPVKPAAYSIIAERLLAERMKRQGKMNGDEEILREIEGSRNGNGYHAGKKRD